MICFSYSSPRVTTKQTVLHLEQEIRNTKPDLSVSVSVVRDDVQPRETGNSTWKASPLRINKIMNEEKRMTDEELYKKVRAIANKLTPRTFETLIKQIKDLTIDTKDRLQAVSDLIFNKAVNTQKFANCYALMCKHLAEIRVNY